MTRSRSAMSPAERLTRARRAILDLLASVGRPLSAGELRHYARGPALDAAERAELLAAMVADGTLETTTVPGSRSHGGTWGRRGWFRPDPITAYQIAHNLVREPRRSARQSTSPTERTNDR
jgi:hypothetical protein